MNKIVKETLSQQIYRVLREDIIFQRIPCGTKLTLKSLQERFELSSTPVREAIKQLSAEGLIHEVTNVGARVITFSHKDITEIYDLCCALDRAALELAMKSPLWESLAGDIEDCVREQRTALSAGDLEAFKRHSDNFHDLFYRYADNSRLYEAATRIRGPLTILTVEYQNMSVSETVVYPEHAAIARAVSAGDCELAMSLLSEHFAAEKNKLLSVYSH